MSNSTKNSSENIKDVKVTLGPLPNREVIEKKISKVLEEKEIRAYYGINTEDRRVVWICGVSSYDFNPKCCSKERFVGILDHALPITSEIVDASTQVILPEKCNSEVDQIRDFFLKFYGIFYDALYDTLFEKLQDFDKAIEDHVETIVWGEETCLLRLRKK